MVLDDVCNGLIEFGENFVLGSVCCLKVIQENVGVGWYLLFNCISGG